jgi:sensor c-di-GMP phosphodiesterase-like protein
MSYLQNLPIDVMKIDRSFVQDLETNAGSRAIAIAIISMGHTLGLKVVAEGIETQAQASMLLDWGCDEGQGYLFAMPLAPEAFAVWVESEKNPA